MRVKNMKRHRKGPFLLTYVENKGAAMGLLKNHRKLLLILTSFVVILISYMLYSAYQTEQVFIYQLSLVLILAGGLSNTLDRFFRGYVIDFFSFPNKKVPFFNIADLWVIVGGVLLIITSFIYDIN